MAESVDLPMGPPPSLEEDNRDVADLWKDALKSYRGIVGFELEPKFSNVQAMLDFGVNEMNNFHSFRHNNKKVDKLRTLFSSNINYLQAGTQQLLAAAVAAFPPAAAISTALTYILTASCLPIWSSMTMFQGSQLTCGYRHVAKYRQTMILSWSSLMT
jgi:hypothetical protein